jgi:GTP-binding protein
MNDFSVAIIAHVDHGKTTLLDALLRDANKQAKAASGERVMDHNDLEKERGITIVSKATSFVHEGVTVNILDTPGHADFGAEVQRVMSMVDGVCLLVDAYEGPMAQTKYVLAKALQCGLKPIVVINKVDRPITRVEEVESEILDLFCELDASEDQLEYPTLYSSGKNGWAATTAEFGDQGQNMKPLLDAIVQHTPPPRAEPEEPFRMLVSIMESDNSIHLGKVLVTGRVMSGSAPVGSKIKAMDAHGNVVEEGTMVKVMTRDGMSRRELPRAEAGGIVTIAGLENARVTHTVCDPSVTEPLASLPIDPPTISMFFSVNDSPLAGEERGNKLTTQQIKVRLDKELESNVAISVSKPVNAQRESYEVRGRGEMQLGILVENMRREGYELSVSPPQVLMKTIDGVQHEPAEEVMVDCHRDHMGLVMEAMVARKCDMVESEPQENDRQKMKFVGPTRGLVGFRIELVRASRGDAVITSLFHGYIPHCGRIKQVRKGVMVSTAPGTATSYTLAKLEARGILFIKPGDEIYEGQVVGETNKADDMLCNPCKTKAVTNVRAAGKEDGIRLIPAVEFQLEEAMAYIENDELLEVTPKKVRIRKLTLEAKKRRGESKSR